MIDTVKHGLIILMVLIVAGCAKTPMEIQQEKELILQNKLQQNGLAKNMFIIQDDATFKRCDNIIVTQVNDNTVIARGNWRSVPEAPTGAVLFSNLTAKPCFALEINAPEGALVKIGEDETIIAKPSSIIRYLAQGEYLIQASKKGYLPYKQKISLRSIMTLSISLQKDINGNIAWKKETERKYSHKSDKVMFANNLAWYMQLIPVPGNYTTIDQAGELCSNILDVEVNNLVIDEFRLPTYREVRDSMSAVPGRLLHREFYPELLTSTPDKKRGYGYKTVRVSNWISGKLRDRASYSVFRWSAPVYVMCVADNNLFKQSIGQLASKMFDKAMKKSLTPTIEKKPQLIKYRELLKGEFETTQQFQQRQKESREATDRLNEVLKLEPWRKRVAQQRKKHQKLLEDLERNKEQHYLDYMVQAMHLKYGKPLLKNIHYDADQEMFSIHISSERNGYSKDVNIPVKLKYAKQFKTILSDPKFEPAIEFEVINSELIFSGIQQIKDPEYLVEEKEYKAAYASISKLKAFIQKYPSSPFRAKAEARISVIAKNNQRAKERRIRLAKEQRIRDAQAAKAQAERNRKAKIARERAAREFATLGVCNVGSSVTHRERWNTTTSSGNIIADGLFGAATKEEFVIYYDGIVQDFVGDKVKVIINDYRIKQTRGGGWFQPQTGRAYEITKHADKYIGKVQFYSRNRCK